MFLFRFYWGCFFVKGSVFLVWKRILYLFFVWCLSVEGVVLVRFVFRYLRFFLIWSIGSVIRRMVVLRVSIVLCVVVFWISWRSFYLWFIVLIFVWFVRFRATWWMRIIRLWCCLMVMFTVITWGLGRGGCVVVYFVFRLGWVVGRGGRDGLRVEVVLTGVLFRSDFCRMMICFLIVRCVIFNGNFNVYYVGLF